jgi:hypothetical protein
MADFIAYSGYGLAGLVQGMSMGDRVVWFLTPLMLLTVILSIYKAVIDFKKDWKKGILHIGMISAGFLLWDLTLNYSIASVNLVGWLEKVKGGYTTEIPAPPTGEIVLTTKNKALYFPLTLPEGLAYATTETMLGGDKDIIQQKYVILLDDPRYIFALAFAKWFNYLRTFDDEEKLKAISLLAYKTGAINLLKTNKEKFPYGKQLADFLTENLPEDCLYSRSHLPECMALQNYFKAVEDIANDLPDNEPYKTYKEFIKKLIRDINSEYVYYSESSVEYKPVIIKIPGLADGLAEGLYKAFINFLKEEGKEPSKALAEIDKNLISSFVSHWISNLKTWYANVSIDKEFNLKFMLTLQRFAYVIMFVVFPFVILLTFMPIGGYNFRLFFEYIVGYFLLKLWTPIVIFAHYLLLYRGLNDIAPFIVSLLPLPSVAYASGVSESIANIITAFSVLQQNAELNSAILNALTYGIPAVMGTGTILMIGRSLWNGIRMSMIEGFQAMQTLTQMAFTIGSAVIGGIQGFARGVSSVGGSVVEGGAKTLDTASTISQNAVRVAGTQTTGKVVKREEGYSLVELSSGASLYLPNTELQPATPEGGTSVSSTPSKTSRMEMLKRGVIEGTKGAIKGIKGRGLSGSHIIIMPH